MVHIILFTWLFVILLFGFGVLYGLLRDKTCKNLVLSIGQNGFLWMSCIGVPVHEFSHYIACKIFGHKVTKVVLFSPKRYKENGNLGFVNHSYNPKNIYQMSGNFLIGVAPVVSATAISYLLLRFLCNVNFDFVPEEMTINFKAVLIALRNSLYGLLNVFKTNIIQYPVFWIALIVLISMFLHVSLSREDFKNAGVGVGAFVIFIPLLSVILSLGGKGLEYFALLYFKIDLIMFFCLSFGLIILAILFLLSCLLKNIKRR